MPVVFITKLTIKSPCPGTISPSTRSPLELLASASKARAYAASAIASFVTLLIANIVQLTLSPAVADFWKQDTLDFVSSKLIAVTDTLI